MKFFYNEMFLEQYTLHKHGHAALDEWRAARPPGKQVEPDALLPGIAYRGFQCGLEIESGCLVQSVLLISYELTFTVISFWLIHLNIYLWTILMYQGQPRW